MLAFSCGAEDLDIGRALMETKWWDYRFIHPGLALMYMAHCYGEARAEWAVKFGDKPPHPGTSFHPVWRVGVKAGKRTIRLHNKAYRTLMWRMMCIADAHGIPYPKFFSLGFAWHLADGLQQLPKPGDMISNRMIPAIVQQFQAELAELLVIPSDPRFYAEAFEGHEWQLACQRRYLDLISRRPAAHHAAYHLIIQRKFIVPTLATRSLSSAVMGEVRRLALRR